MRLVHLPEAGGPVRREIRRRHPHVSLRRYKGDPFSVARARGDVLVVYCNTPPRGGPRNAIGMTEHGSRVVLVFTNCLRAALRLRWTDPRLATAIGSTVAHELEHLRRKSRAHDRAGWFRACATPEGLIGRRPL